MSISLQTEGLSIQFKNFTALDNVSIQMEKGRIYGLIGKNGAGKTTLMKVLAGILMPSEGSFCILGADSKEELQLAKKYMGCLIEYPGIIPYMSAKENISFHVLLRHIRISDEGSILSAVGLSSTDTKKVKNYSLGMKQRLGIAIALLCKPQILILDEPMNGLDPIGVKAIQSLLQKCKEQGMTILISSHNLEELTHIADHYFIIDQGKIIESLSSEQLNETNDSFIQITCTDIVKLKQVLKQYGINSFHQEGDTVIIQNAPYDFEQISKILNQHNLTITSFNKQKETLEHYYLKLLGRCES